MKAGARRIPVMLALVSLLLLATGTGEVAAFQSHMYSYRKGHSCAEAYVADPLGLVVYGKGATMEQVAGHFSHTVDQYGQIHYIWHKGLIERYTGWSNHAGEQLFEQDFLLPEVGCTRNDGATDQASDSGAGHDRYHARLWTLNVSSRTNREIYGTPHYEHWRPHSSYPNCGSGVPGGGSHAVTDENSKGYSGFDLANIFLYHSFFNRKQAEENVYEGNTRSVKQCDGKWVASNGFVLRVPNGKPGH